MLYSAISIKITNINIQEKERGGVKKEKKRKRNEK